VKWPLVRAAIIIQGTLCISNGLPIR